MVLAFAGDLRGALLAVRGRSDDPAAWLRAYIAATRGAFIDAEAGARRLLRSADVGVAAALTLGSVLRQTDRHALAQPVDSRALRDADTLEERAHALISLAADAVGAGDRQACARRLRAATAVVPAGAWRARVRLCWVQTEHALLCGDAGRAVAAANVALARARRAGARRHEAKSLLFLGVALGEAHREQGARSTDLSGVAELRRARILAREIGAQPIARVASDVLRSQR